MNISFNGLSSFKLSTKNAAGKEQILVTDPYDPKTAGLKLSHVRADIVLVSSDSPLYNNISLVKPNLHKETFIINSPGEYESHGVFVQGVLASDSTTTMYYLEIERLKVVFLGALNNGTLSEAQQEVLEDPDILIIPVGGGQVIGAKQAAQIVKQLEPRLVIPMHYKTTGVKAKLPDTPDMFLKELGVKDVETVEKLKITTKDLPQDQLRVVMLK